MRIFSDFIQAQKEIERDLIEMGTLVTPESMQDVDIKGKDEYITKELLGYTYCITQLTKHDIKRSTKILHLDRDYILQEHQDRTNSKILNPGNAWKRRPDVWKPFLHEGKFSYTYNERMQPQLWRVVKELKEKPNSRQIVVPIYNPTDQANWGGTARVPCSMYYQLFVRKFKEMPRLYMIYTMRSCDFYTHFPYDVLLAKLLQQHIANKTGFQDGPFIHFIGSLHAYKKDWKKGVF